MVSDDSGPDLRTSADEAPTTAGVGVSDAANAGDAPTSAVEAQPGDASTAADPPATDDASSTDRMVGTGESTMVDLDAVERDLSAVEAALARLSDGTYYTDEVTGQPLPDELLAADPTARRA